MFGPQPIAAARCILFLTVLVLPADARDRYREEFRGEISGLGAVAQLPESLSLLLGSDSLRSALKEREMTVTQPLKQDWRCHLGRHHFVVKPDDNPEVRGQTVWNAPDVAGTRTVSTSVRPLVRTRPDLRFQASAERVLFGPASDARRSLPWQAA